MGARHIATLALLAGGAAIACSSNLDAGGVGTLRYAGRVKGVAPLNLLPPIADLAGNIYVLNGAPTVPETHAFVGAVGGGWNATCNLTKGDAYGAHGWVGFSGTEAWYWSGEALVATTTTSCHPVLDHDPSTNADLLFQGVMPGVRALTARTTAVAFVQSPTDPLPFTALVDLNNEILTNVQSFQPPNAIDAQIVGVGGDRDRERGITLVQYRVGSNAFLELRGYDGEANETDRVGVSGGPFGAYAVQGYLQMDDGDLVAGLIADKDQKLHLLTADGSGGDVKDVTGMDPVGVHRWQGQLWLVGTASKQPVVAAISRGGLGQVTQWSASLGIAGAFDSTTLVRDDRSLPSREVTWSNVRTAVGAFPLLSPHSLTEHAPSTALWVFQGPVDEQGTLTMTAFGVAPVGVTYP